MEYSDLTKAQKKHVDSMDKKLVAKAWELEMLPQNFDDSAHLEEGIFNFLRFNPARAAAYFDKHPDEAEAFHQKIREVSQNG